MITSNQLLGLKHLSLDDTSTVAASGTALVLIQPPRGQIYKVISVDFKALDPAGSGSGTHKLMGRWTSGNDIYLFSLTANTGSNMYIAYGAFDATTEVPSTAPEQLKILTDTIWASYDEPFKLAYTNSTDVQQAQDREIDVLVLVYKECL